MKRLLQEIGWFWRQKIYVGMLCLTAACSYGFAVTHYSIGIDDTAVSLYLEEGLEVVMGRWTVFLVNKLFHLSDFTPFMSELVGVLLLMLGVTLFAVLMRRIFGQGTGIWGYTLFACAFLSNPILSEVYIYYYHDGVDLGYVLTALALLSFMEGMERTGRGKLSAYLGSMVFVWIASGCYESLIILYILGILLIVFLRGAVGKDRLTFSHLAKNLGTGALLSAGCVILRSITIPLMTVLFGLQDAVGILPQRSLTEMFTLFRGKEGLLDFFMLVKRFWVVYHVNALVYLPVTVYETACICMGIYAVVMAVRKKNLWYPVLFAGMLITPFLLTVATAEITLYRACQYLPFFAAAGVLVIYRAFEQKKKSVPYLRYAVSFLGIVLLWNQAAMMNRNFYRDYQKYEYTRGVLSKVAYEVEKTYGTDLPVVFTGHDSVPYEFVSDYYVGYGSWQYRMIAGITDLVDEHLKEKYFQPQGYCFIGEAQYPFIQWAFDAFDGTNREMIAFLKMHGNEFSTVSDKEILEQAREIGDSMPGWPAEGSISLQDGYVLVHFDE
ncbi:MAG: glucosyltransferase domain-containing protein [Bacteroidales bacterium]|nr:glucosyltransferase domain-containing protein [Lachnoclostridium sp.]MCM1383237.1 glucosyltransferase domain-containing protein [Lachnoclostridium sp.]MCM1466486.1 glucosyltransferase domain-containing protein [Bacteroidales bacterium]